VHDVLRPDRSVGPEAVRIARRQLRLAIDDLRGTGSEHVGANVARAYKRVTEVRALIMLLKPALNNYDNRTDNGLRDVMRVLGGIVDTKASRATLRRLAARAQPRLRGWTVSLLLGEILTRQGQADEAMPRVCLLDRAAATLRAERRRIKRWRLERDGLLAVAQGLQSMYTRARAAMADTTARPGDDSFRVWQERVHDHWLQVRLIGPRTGHGFGAEERDLRRLDVCLDERRRLALLSEVLTSRGIVPRDETARALRAIRTRERELERDVWIVGRRVYHDRPNHAVRRAYAMWEGEDHPAAAALQSAA